MTTGEDVPIDTTAELMAFVENACTEIAEMPDVWRDLRRLFAEGRTRPSSTFPRIVASFLRRTRAGRHVMFLNNSGEEYDYDYRRRWPKRAAIAAVLALVAAAAVWIFSANTTTRPAAIPFDLSAVSSQPAAVAQEAPVLPAADLTADTTAAAASSPTSAPSTSAAPTSVSSPADTAPATTGTPVPTSPGVPAGTPYPQLPDGQPQPVVAIFDTSTITLTGEVPSAAAVARLSSLAVANSQTPAVVVNNLIINPAVPISVGVRVIELNSVRFPTASANVLPAHAKELDRVANVMKALPNVSVLVIGHADQRGTDMNNLAISTARAQAVLNYLLYVGISPSRLTSQGVGATDLLTAQTDDVALALNRRTEFIFYGLLIG